MSSLLDLARRRQRPLLILAGAAMVIASLAMSMEPVAALLFVFVVVVPFEKWKPRHADQPIRRKGLLTDIAHGLAAPLVAPVGLTVAIIIGSLSFGWLPGLAVRPLVAMLPSWLSLAVGFLMFDLIIYWTHRLSHEVPFLWRFHAVHHSTETLDWVSGFRQHPFDGVILAPAFFFMLGAGFSAEYGGALALIQIVTGIFLHANVRWRLRPLHKLIITPEFHHWHHTNEPMAIHSNYSVFLPLWDIAFGTYFMPSNRRPEVYGIDEYMPDGLAAQMLWPLRGMGNPVRVGVHAVRHPIRSTRFVARFTRQLCRQMWRSARRPTRNVTGIVPTPPRHPYDPRQDSVQRDPQLVSARR